MMRCLVLKLLRDIRVALLVVCLLLALFQVLWARITTRITGDLVPEFSQEMSLDKIKEKIFEGPGKLMQTFMGGESIHIERTMDILSIGYVHPAMIVLFCIWSIGRASGAIAGEIDRGTMELLLAQPIPRSRVVLSHLIVDGIVITVLCLSMWSGTWLGAWLFTPIEPAVVESSAPDEFQADRRFQLLLEIVEQVRKQGPQLQQGAKTEPGQQDMARIRSLVLEFQREIKKKPLSEEESRTFAVYLLRQFLSETNHVDPAERAEMLRVTPAAFGPSLINVATMLFALSGTTMWLSARGRFRWKVMGLAVLVTLIQFLVNLLGQLWETIEWLRPFTIFYYYQPQEIILHRRWTIELGTAWNGGRPLFAVPGVLVLFLVGAIGYTMALRVFCRRDLPAPL